jgi:hypothetical protein
MDRVPRYQDDVELILIPPAACQYMSTAFIETRSESLTSGLSRTVFDGSRVNSLNPQSACRTNNPAVGRL